MKEIAEEQSLRDTGTVVEVDHPTRGKYLTVGNPIKLSDSPCDVKRSPLLGEHTEEVLTKVLGYTAKEVADDQGLGRDVGRGKITIEHGSDTRCESSFTASRRSGRPCSRRC